MNENAMPSARNWAELLTFVPLLVAAVAWAIPSVAAVPGQSQWAHVVALPIPLWLYALGAAAREKSFELRKFEFTIDSLRAMNHATLARAIAIVGTVGVWLVIVLINAANLGLTTAAFGITVIAISMLWAARSIARKSQVGLMGGAVSAAYRARDIMVYALFATAVAWIPPSISAVYRFHFLLLLLFAFPIISLTVALWQTTKEDPLYGLDPIKGLVFSGSTLRRLVAKYRATQIEALIRMVALAISVAVGALCLFLRTTHGTRVAFALFVTAVSIFVMWAARSTAARARWDELSTIRGSGSVPMR
jgi:hypothetical protein